ncbi:hypothetical protein D3C76_1065370 [compost metagenome]
MIKGGETPGEQVGRLVGEVGGEAKTQVAGHGGHGRHQQQRIVDRQLDRLFERHVERLAVDVIRADDVGDEQPVEQPTFQQTRQVGPVFEGLVLGRGVARMRPQPMVDMPDAVHVERIEEDLPGHQMVPRRGGFSLFR